MAGFILICLSCKFSRLVSVIFYQILFTKHHYIERVNKFLLLSIVSLIFLFNAQQLLRCKNFGWDEVF